MKYASLRRQLVLVAALLTISPIQCALAGDTPDPSTTEVLELRGTIGKGLAVHMHLEKRDVLRKQGSDTFVVGEQYLGYYYYDKHRQRIELRGYFNAQGPGGAADEAEVELSEYVEGKKTGVFTGQFGDTGYSGRWQALGADRSLPFTLRVVSRVPKK